MFSLAEEQQVQDLIRTVAPGSQLLRAWPLKGGISAEVVALEVALPDGREKKLVARRHSEADRQRNPHLAADEFRLLQALWMQGLAVARPFCLGLVGGVSVVVTQYVKGAVELKLENAEEYLFQLADQLVMIHGVDVAEVDFLPQKAAGAEALVLPSESAAVASPGERGATAALTKRWPKTGWNAPALLHGDFWPGNVLWRKGTLAAVIDWEDACIGDPLFDLANARLELLWAGGRQAMDVFTDCYRAIAPDSTIYTNLPACDLSVALSVAPKIDTWGLAIDARQRMLEQLEWFVRQALDGL